MDYLRYASNEMFSSTDLIRKSKMIFNKLSKKEIEKAIVLRDGKPAFMLLDFDTYEKIMKEYLHLKENTKSEVKENFISIDDIKIKEKEAAVEELYEDRYEDYEESAFAEIDDEELQKALEEIDKITFVDEATDKKEDKKETPLKEFWD